jgi:ATP-dependent DNA helicase RecQ
MADTDLHRLRLIIDELAGKGYLHTEAGEYPVLSLTEKSRPVLRGEITLTMMLPQQTEKKSAPAKEAAASLAAVPAAGFSGKQGLLPVAPGEASPQSEALFARLKELRTALAREAAVPAYVIFSDASLHDMCRRRPTTAERFLEVSGVGQIKLERYGEAFMAVIRELSGC